MSDLPEKAFFAHIRKWFLSGILFLFPIAITNWLLGFLIGWTQGFARPIVSQGLETLTSEKNFDVPNWIVTLFSLLTVITFVILVGWLANFYIGKKILSWVDRILLKVPLVRSLYGGTKQIMDAFSMQSGSFKRVVMFEYPRRDCWAIGFVTNENLAQTSRVFGRSVIGIFLPSTPNPTTGFLLYMEPKDIWILNMDVESAVKMIVSGGLVSPGNLIEKPINFQDALDERNKVLIDPFESPNRGPEPVAKAIP